MARRRRRIFALLTALLAVALLAVALLRYVFVVRSVQVEGNGSVSAESVVRAADVGFGSSIFRVNGEKIAQNVNALGTLCFEDVRIRYPNTVYITVRERERVAMLLYMGKIRVLDAEGYLVESMDEVPDTDLVYVSGMQIASIAQGAQLRAAEGQAEAYVAIMGALKDQQAQIYISEMNVSDVEALILISRGGTRVELGDSSNMENKIAWVKSAVADLESRGEGGGMLDVRSGTKADYTRAGSSETAASE